MVSEIFMTAEEENWLQYERADKLLDLGLHNEALGILRSLAKNGNGAAMSRIALLYFEGHGVEKDFAESIKWDLAAIAAGYDTSMANLALTYCSLREYREARRWFERSVELGDGDSALELAKLLYVSDSEIENVKRLLDIAIDSDLITPASLEEASTFRRKLD
jgi:TPR repeat protein